MAKSVVVIVERKCWVNKYRTWKTYTRKYMAHDGLDTCNVGDVIKIEQLPQKLSRQKAFNVVEVLQREKIVMPDQEEAGAAASFRQLPDWARLSPAVADSIRQACDDFSDYYRFSKRKEAFALIHQFPGLKSRLAAAAFRRPR
jgi:small subunit ribosomal protein S17